MVNELLVSVRETNHAFIQKGKITHVYGPPKIGKSTLSAVIALELARSKKKVLIISTERPIEIRMESMIVASSSYSSASLAYIFTTEIYTLKELVAKLTALSCSDEFKADLLIIDSLTATYRPVAGPIALTMIRNSLASLQGMARKKAMAILFTNQVSAIPNDSTNFRPVASASTRGYSDFTLRLSRKQDGKTEPVFESFDGEETVVLSPFTIIPAGIEETHELFLFE
jgi:RecA/RadA recombinase